MSFQFHLENIRPDFLLLLVVSRALILWDSVMPSNEWVLLQCPPIIQRFSLRKNRRSNISNDTLETVHQAEVFLLAGCCLALGLRFAGTANQDAVDTIMDVFGFLKTGISQNEAKRINPINIASCIQTALLSAAMVMAGTGYIPIIRAVLQLRTNTNAKGTYGCQIATHMALGFLFLGGGTVTLSRSEKSIAALFLACFPKFPKNTTDNQYHLQACRHLYTQAAVPRMLLAKNIDSQEIVHVPILITFQEKLDHREETCSLNLVTPCLLPVSLSKIISIQTAGHRFFPNIVRPMSNSAQRLVLMKDLTLYVKLRPGRVPYKANTLVMQDLAAQAKRLLGVATPHTLRPSSFPSSFDTILSSEEHISVELSERELAIVEQNSYMHDKRNDISATFAVEPRNSLPLDVVLFGKPEYLDGFLACVATNRPFAVNVARTLIFLHRTLSATRTWLQTGKLPSGLLQDLQNLQLILSHTHVQGWRIYHVADSSSLISPEVEGIVMRTHDEICALLEDALSPTGQLGSLRQTVAMIAVRCDLRQLACLSESTLHASMCALSLLFVYPGSLFGIDARIREILSKNYSNSTQNLAIMTVLADYLPVASVVQIRVLCSIFSY
eukprot:gene5120-159_t